jgi:hypothetical protein
VNTLLNVPHATWVDIYNFDDVEFKRPVSLNWDLHHYPQDEPNRKYFWISDASGSLMMDGFMSVRAKKTAALLLDICNAKAVGGGP